MKHLLPALAAAQALGIALAASDRAPLELALPAGVAAGVHGLCCRGARAHAALSLLIALSAGAAAAGLSAARSGKPLTAPWSGVVEGVVAGVRVTPGRWSVDLAGVRSVSGAAELPKGVRLRGGSSEDARHAFERLPPGSRVRASLRLRPPGGLRNPGGRDPARVWRQAGIGAVGRLADPTLFVRLPGRDGLLARVGLHRLRTKLAEALSRLGPGGGLLRALAVGDRGGLEAQDREAFAVLGLAHLLAVSGLHLGLVASAAYGLLRRAAVCWPGLAARIDVRTPALLGAVAAALAFALLAGWGVPVRRALVLLLSLAASFAMRRPLSALAPLALASIWILAGDPLALLSPGTQLSFVATAALVIGLRHRGEVGGAGVVGRGLRASATALAVTTPLAAAHWGSQAPLALAANALALPWTGLVLLPGALAATGCVWLGGGGAVDWIAFAAERAAAFTLQAAHWVAGWAPGRATAPPPAVPWLLAASGIGLLALRLRSTRGRALVALTVALVISHAPSSTVLPTAPRIVSFDVAHGDAVLIQGREAAVLVDAGGALPTDDLGRRAVVPALRALGVERLDLLVASHGDLDHRGGIAAVLAALPVAELWLPLGADRDPSFETVREAAAARRVPVREVGAGADPWHVGDVVVQVLWPPRGLGGLGRNDLSLVLRVVAAGRRVLLPGDLERTGEEALVALGVDLSAEVLKLPHHGSRSSSSAVFLRAVSPEIAIASAPCLGRWGMPHDVVRKRVREIGAALWWTGRDGAVGVGLAPRLHAVGSGPARACDSATSAR